MFCQFFITFNPLKKRFYAVRFPVFEGKSVTFADSAIFNQSKSQFKAAFYPLENTCSISQSKACTSLMPLCHQSPCFPLPVHWLDDFLLPGAAEMWRLGDGCVSRRADDEKVAFGLTRQAEEGTRHVDVWRCLTRSVTPREFQTGCNGYRLRQRQRGLIGMFESTWKPQSGPVTDEVCTFFQSKMPKMSLVWPILC